MTYNAGQFVYERLKALEEHNSIQDLNRLRLGYRRSAREHKQSIKTITGAWKGYPEHYYLEDVQRHEEAAAAFTAMYKAVERLIRERKAEQPATSARHAGRQRKNVTLRNDKAERAQRTVSNSAA